MKLSKAQAKVMEEAKARIDEARNLSFYEWYRLRYQAKNYTDAQIDDEIARFDKDIREKDYHINKYINERNGITLVVANTRTLRKMEEMGLIELVENGGSYPDHIRIINY